MAPKAAPDAKPLTGVIAAITVLLSLACVWLRFPAGVVLLIGIALAAFMMSPPRLTGKPGADGIATPVGAGEERMLAEYTKWSTIRRQLLSPASWAPMPTTESLLALGLAAFVFTLPTDLQNDYVPADIYDVFNDPGLLHPVYTPLASAICFYITVHACLQAGRMKEQGEPKPAVGFSEVAAASSKMGKGILIVIAFALLLALGAGVFVWLFLEASDGFIAEWALYPAAAGGGVFALVFAGILHMFFGPAVMKGWGQRQEARALWKPRWMANQRLLETPQLAKHERFGEQEDWHADTFHLPASIGGARKAIAMYEAIEHAFAGYQTVFLSAPIVGDDGQPTPGTRDPNMLLAYTWPAGAQQSLAEPGLDVMQVQMMVQRAIVQSAFRAKVKEQPPLVTAVEKLHSDSSPTGLWKASVALPEDTGAGELAEMMVKLRESGLDGLLVDGDARVQIMQDKSDLIMGVFTDETEIADDAVGKHLVFVGVQDYWHGRFSAVGKMKRFPELLDHATYGDGSFWVDEFSVPAGVGKTADFTKMLSASVPPDANDRRTLFMSAPKRNAQGEVIPGTRDETKMAAYTWPDGQRPDITDPNVDLELMKVWSQAMLKYSYDEAGVQAGVALVQRFEPLHDPASEGTTAAWAMSLTQPDVGVDLSYMLGFAIDMGGLPDLITGGDPSLGLVQDGDLLYFGALGESTEFADPRTPVIIERLYAEKDWTRAWHQGGAKRPPLPVWDSKEEFSLPSGAVMHKMMWSAPFGDPLSTYLDLKPDSLKTAMNPLVTHLAISPQPARGTQGTSERDDSFFSLVWTHDNMSTAPHAVKPDPEPESESPGAGGGPRYRRGRRRSSLLRGRPNRGQQLVMEIAIFNAFSRVKLEQPTVLRAAPLTSSRSHQHLWDIEIRLFGQVTLQTLRTPRVFQALKNALSASYLRVAPTMDGNIRILVGADPRNELDFVSDAAFASTVQLDWEQTFQSSNVLHDGEAPQLVDVGVLPKNRRVQKLVFQLPRGMHPAKVRGAKDKLAGSAEMAFMDIKDGPAPGQVTVMCSVEDPLLSPMMFDWSAVDASKDIAFGSSITGEPIEYDRAEDPHILVLGQSGSGKAQPLDARIPVPVSERFPDGWALNGDLVVGDEVYEPGGSITSITSFSDEREEPVFEVTTDDGQRTMVSGHHMWRLRTTGSASRLAFQKRSVDTDRAARLYALASRIGSEVGGTPEQLTRLANLDTGELETSGVLHKALVRHGLESTGVAATVYEMDGVLQHALGIADSCGHFTFAGHDLTREDLLDLALDGMWLSPASLAHSLVPAASEREIELAQALVDGLGVPSREGVERKPVALYPVDEVLRLLADRYQGEDCDEQIVTTEHLADILAAGEEAQIRMPAPIPGGAGFMASDFTNPTEPLPTFVLRGSARSRLELVQLWLSRSTEEHGWSVLDAKDDDVAASMVELARSAGVKAKRHGSTVMLSEDTTLRVTSVARGRSVVQRCLRTAESSHLYLTNGFVPTHNSAAMQALLTVALMKGFDAVIVDPMKRGGDFRYAEDWILGFASDAVSAGAVMDRVRKELKRRSDLTEQYGVNKTSQLPPEVRPRPLAVLVDEFTSLMTTGGQKPKMPEDGSDRAAMEEYSNAEAEFEGKRIVSEVTGRLAREARSFDIMLILGGQKLPSDLIKSMPNNAGASLKDNMSRLVLGKTSYGEKMSAFKSPDAVPDLGEEVPIGRGVFEGKGAPKIVQVWYDSPADPVPDDVEHQQSMASHIAAARAPLTADEKWDVKQLVERASSSADRFGQVIEEEPTIDLKNVPDIDAIEEVDVNDFSFDDMPSFDDDGEESAPVSLDPPEEVSPAAEELGSPPEDAAEIPVFTGLDDEDVEVNEAAGFNESEWFDPVGEWAAEEAAQTAVAEPEKPDFSGEDSDSDEDESPESIDWGSFFDDAPEGEEPGEEVLELHDGPDANDAPELTETAFEEEPGPSPNQPSGEDTADIEADLFGDSRPVKQEDLFDEPKVSVIDDDLFGD